LGGQEARAREKECRGGTVKGFSQNSAEKGSKEFRKERKKG